MTLYLYKSLKAILIIYFISSAFKIYRVIIIARVNTVVRLSEFYSTVIAHVHENMYENYINIVYCQRFKYILLDYIFIYFNNYFKQASSRHWNTQSVLTQNSHL